MAFKILQFRERLTENLSSEQIADTLDILIFNALRPIMLYTEHVEQTLAEILPFIASNARRKFSNRTQAELVDGLFSVIVGQDKKAKLKLLKGLRVERTVYFTCFDSFLRLAAQHSRAEIAYISTPRKQKQVRYQHLQTMQRIERALGIRPSQNLRSISAKVQYWQDAALDFRGMIIEKFVRLAYVDSGKAIKQTSLQVDHGDLLNDFLLAVPRALDKYNPEKGALTSYVRWWFVDAKAPNINRHEYGTAFAMPAAMRRKQLAEGTMMVSNLTTSIDSEQAGDVEDGATDLLTRLIDDEEARLTGNLAARADPHKMAALLHEIPYKLSPAERAALLATMREPAIQAA